MDGKMEAGRLTPVCLQAPPDSLMVYQGLAKILLLTVLSWAWRPLQEINRAITRSPEAKAKNKEMPQIGRIGAYPSQNTLLVSTITQQALLFKQCKQPSQGNKYSMEFLATTARVALVTLYPSATAISHLSTDSRPLSYGSANHFTTRLPRVIKSVLVSGPIWVRCSSASIPP